ncbi:MAG: OmpA family protein [Deltaproteobacteria bacterium]|nr:OmpA family protein [Deltaproteobacteria bacterium]
MNRGMDWDGLDGCAVAWDTGPAPLAPALERMAAAPAPQVSTEAPVGLPKALDVDALDGILALWPVPAVAEAAVAVREAPEVLVPIPVAASEQAVAVREAPEVLVPIPVAASEQAVAVPHELSAPAPVREVQGEDPLPPQVVTEALSGPPVASGAVGRVWEAGPVDWDGLDGALTAAPTGTLVGGDAPRPLAAAPGEVARTAPQAPWAAGPVDWDGLDGALSSPQPPVLVAEGVSPPVEAQAALTPAVAAEPLVVLEPVVSTAPVLMDLDPGTLSAQLAAAPLVAPAPAPQPLWEAGPVDWDGLDGVGVVALSPPVSVLSTRPEVDVAEPGSRVWETGPIDWDGLDGVVVAPVVRSHAASPPAEVPRATGEVDLAGLSAAAAPPEAVAVGTGALSGQVSREAAQAEAVVAGPADASALSEAIADEPAGGLSEPLDGLPAGGSAPAVDEVAVSAVALDEVAVSGGRAPRRPEAAALVEVSVEVIPVAALTPAAAAVAPDAPPIAEPGAPQPQVRAPVGKDPSTAGGTPARRPYGAPARQKRRGEADIRRDLSKTMLQLGANESAAPGTGVQGRLGALVEASESVLGEHVTQSGDTGVRLFLDEDTSPSVHSTSSFATDARLRGLIPSDEHTGEISSVTLTTGGIAIDSGLSDQDTGAIPSTVVRNLAALAEKADRGGDALTKLADQLAPPEDEGEVTEYGGEAEVDRGDIAALAEVLGDPGERVDPDWADEDQEPVPPAGRGSWWVWGAIAVAALLTISVLTVGAGGAVAWRMSGADPERAPVEVAAASPEGEHAPLPVSTGPSGATASNPETPRAPGTVAASEPGAEPSAGAERDAGRRTELPEAPPSPVERPAAPPVEPQQAPQAAAVRGSAPNAVDPQRPEGTADAPPIPPRDDGSSWVLSFAFEGMRHPDSSVPSWVLGCDALEVTGHTCSLGDEQANYAVGLVRARLVRDMLIRAGVADGAVTVRSAGETAPVADNGTLAGRVRNRRVEVRCVPR